MGTPSEAAIVGGIPPQSPICRQGASGLWIWWATTFTQDDVFYTWLSCSWGAAGRGCDLAQDSSLEQDGLQDGDSNLSRSGHHERGDPEGAKLGGGGRGQAVGRWLGAALEEAAFWNSFSAALAMHGRLSPSRHIQTVPVTIPLSPRMRTLAEFRRMATGRLDGLLRGPHYLEHRPTRLEVTARQSHGR